MIYLSLIELSCCAQVIKTHLGVRLADIIYRNSEEKVLCLCYTNHALDDFLGDIIKHDMHNIVRIGGRAAPALEKYNLRELARATLNMGKGRGPEDKRHGRQVYNLKTEIEECETSIRNINSELGRSTVGANWWHTVGPHLFALHAPLRKTWSIFLGLSCLVMYCLSLGLSHNWIFLIHILQEPFCSLLP
jgi:hypothetical protein